VVTLFLSYTRSDSPAIDRLAGDLRGLGCTPWFDNELAGGVDWWRKILAKVRESDVFMLGVSNESLDSPACQAEFTYARSLGRAVLPVLIADDVTFSALPRDLAVLQLVDYRRDDKKALMSLARSLLHLEPRKPLPDELPPESL